MRMHGWHGVAYGSGGEEEGGLLEELGQPHYGF